MIKMLKSKKGFGAFAQLALVIGGLIFLMTIIPEAKDTLIEILSSLS